MAARTVALTDEVRRRGEVLSRARKRAREAPEQGSAQLLDISIVPIAIVRKTGPVPPSLILPDGLEGLSDFNLFNYKSLHQAVDAWVLQELIGHYVNDRKLLVEPSGALLPEASFRLHALSTRELEVLSSHEGIEAGDRPGIYDITWFQPSLRLIVLPQTETRPENGLWQLFSGRPDRVADGARRDRPSLKTGSPSGPFVSPSAYENGSVVWRFPSFPAETTMQKEGAAASAAAPSGLAIRAEPPTSFRTVGGAGLRGSGYWKKPEIGVNVVDQYSAGLSA